MASAVEIFYDTLSAGFDAEQDAANFAFIRKPETEQIVQYISEQNLQNAAVLEIGAGTGRFSTTIASHSRTYTALDISGQMLAILEEKSRRLNLNNLTTVKDDFLQHEFAQKYDYIFSFSAIEYIKDKRALFTKIASLLNPGGKVYITTAHNTFIRFFGRMGNYVRQKIYMSAYTKAECLHLLPSCGLEILSLHDSVMNFKPFFKGILLEIQAKKDE